MAPCHCFRCWTQIDVSSSSLLFKTEISNVGPGPDSQGRQTCELLTFKTRIYLDIWISTLEKRQHWVRALHGSSWLE